MIDKCQYNWIIYCDKDSDIYIEDISLIRKGIIISTYSGNCEQYNWGEPDLFFRDSDLRLYVPDTITINWHNKDCGTYYSHRIDLCHANYLKDGDIIVVGITSYGTLAVWIISNKKSDLIYQVAVKADKNSELNSQFKYRYIIRLINQHENTLENGENTNGLIGKFYYIEESLYDGTFDKLHDGGLLKYHQAGKPKKLAIKWHIDRSEYSAYFWFEDERIREVFDKFYGAHPDTKTDFIIRIDAENRKYELALYRYGLKEPQIIPENVYQLLVFKNKFEDYRSDNYNQERGAWIW